MSSFKIYNTLTRSTEEFIPINGMNVGMYCCGPTVHNYAHIGNFRTFLFSDLIRRYLEYKGFIVNHVMNITDVDDKIIESIHKSGKSLFEYTDFYKKEFINDLVHLNCLLPTTMPHATDNIQEIISLIEKLIIKNVAYVDETGSVYFSINNYQLCGCKYGKLKNINHSAEKYLNSDFALWKSHVASDGHVFWKSPWGNGRPGWHIECSAMSMKFLGNNFDIHLGGEDLIFPHHENEIAQSESASTDNKPFVKYWLHCAHLQIEGNKMSKSLNNFFTLRDIINKGYTGREIRLMLLSAHYRDTFNFTWNELNNIKNNIKYIDRTIAKLKSISNIKIYDDTKEKSIFINNITESLDNDFNMASVIRIILEWINEINNSLSKNLIASDMANKLLADWSIVDNIIGIGTDIEINPSGEILSMLNSRENARKSKDFILADLIRSNMINLGWNVNDTINGPRLYKI